MPHPVEGVRLLSTVSGRPGGKTLHSLELIIMMVTVMVMMMMMMIMIIIMIRTEPANANYVNITTTSYLCAQCWQNERLTYKAPSAAF